MTAPIPGPPMRGPQYLEYPSNIGSDIKHWIAFKAFNFKNRETTLHIAMYTQPP